MKSFKKLYIFAMNAKLYMAIYFVATLFIVSLITFLFGGKSITILTLLEMLLVNFINGFLQAFLLNENTDFSHGIFFGRSTAWIILSVGISSAVCIICKWFEGYPNWCILLFVLLLTFGFCAMLIGLKFEQDADTVKLNHNLEHYKSN